MKKTEQKVGKTSLTLFPKESINNIGIKNCLGQENIEKEQNLLVSFAQVVAAGWFPPENVFGSSSH